MKREELNKTKQWENEEGVELTEKELTAVSGGGVDALCRKCLLCPKKGACVKPERFKNGCNNNRDYPPNQSV